MADNKIVLVKMKKRSGNNYAGEVCGFTTERAAELVKIGGAEYVRPIGDAKAPGHGMFQVTKETGIDGSSKYFTPIDAPEPFNRPEGAAELKGKMTDEQIKAADAGRKIEKKAA